MKDFLKKCWRATVRVCAAIGALLVLAILFEAINDDYRWRYRYHQRNHTSELPYGCKQVVRRGHIRIIDAQGHTIIRRVDEIMVRDSMAVIVKDHKRGYVNLRQGKLAVNPQYDHAWLFGCGLGAVVKGGKLGFVDAEGREVIPCQFAYYKSGIYEYVFKEGHCAVVDPQTMKAGIINAQGEWTIQPDYDYAVARTDGAMVYKKGGWKQLYAYDGTLLRDHMIDYSYTLDYPASFTNKQTGERGSSNCMIDDLRRYTVFGMDGLMTSGGVFITPPIYDNIEAISADVFLARLPDNGADVIIDRKGRLVE